MNEVKVKQELFFDKEDGKLKVKTACGVSDGLNQQAYFNDGLTFEASTETVQRLLAERETMTFLPVGCLLSVVSSDKKVVDFMKECDSTIGKLRKLNESTEQHLQSCEKALNEKNDEYEKLVMQVKCFNAMPFWKRIFKKLIVNDND